MKVPPPPLPPELILHIAKLLLDDDVLDYISFRAVCPEWRSYTASPGGLVSCFRPHRWIMLYKGSDAKLDTSHRHHFLNVSTGRGLVLHLPELATFSVFSDSDGLLFLIDLSSYAIRLFNPFTRHLAHLPNYPDSGAKLTASFFRKRLSNTSISTGSCPTVMVLDTELRTVYFAKPGDSCWNLFHFQGACPTSMVCFRDQFYIASTSGIQSFDLQERSLRLLIPPLSTNFIEGILDRCYITEFNKGILLVNQKRYARRDGSGLAHMSLYSVYRVDLECNRLVPILNNRDLAIFLGRRCFAFSLNGLPSIQPNSVYHSCQGEGMHPLCSIGLYNMDEEVELSRGIAAYLGPRLPYLGPKLASVFSSIAYLDPRLPYLGPTLPYLNLPLYLAAYCLSSY